MRVWDVNPGYLNDQSLLGEHRELHGIVSIITNNKKGYSRHPETLRWVGFGWALRQRHQLLCAEMSLRGFQDKTPVPLRAKKDAWPSDYIDAPGVQYDLLMAKYLEKSAGRIPLPETSQALWAQHKYSVMARDLKSYKSLGQLVAKTRKRTKFYELAYELSTILRERPDSGGVRNALQHMWGYVNHFSERPPEVIHQLGEKELLKEIQRLSQQYQVTYITSSTALSELAAWL